MRRKRTPLTSAIISGHAEVVGELMRGGAKVTESDLYRAAHSGTREVLREVLRARENLTPQLLFEVCGSRGPEIVQDIVLAFLNQDVTSRTPLTALMVACMNGNVEVVLELLTTGTNVNEHHAITGVTALMWATFNGNIEVVKKLCESGATLTASTSMFGLTALSIACLCKHLDVINELCAQGVSVDGPIAKCTLFELFGISPCSYLVWASWKGHLEVVEALCNGGVDVNASIATDGTTALMVACKYEKLSIVDELLSRGATANASKKDGTTALSLAFDLHDCHTMLALVLLLSPDVDVRDKYGRTALMILCEKGNLDLIQNLCQRGANVNATDNDGVTALMFACRRGHLKIVRELFKRGALLNTETIAIHSPDFICEPDSFFYDGRAFSRAKFWFLRSFFSCLKPFLPSRTFTPLDFACCFRNPEIATFLLNSGVSMTQSVKETIRALHKKDPQLWKALLDFPMEDKLKPSGISTRKITPL
jgi:ankyrin repeat protein